MRESNAVMYSLKEVGVSIYLSSRINVVFNWFVLQTILAMETSVIPFVPHLYPVLLKTLQDEDSEVRGNCTYALGVLAAYGGDPILVYLFTQWDDQMCILNNSQMLLWS